MPSSVYPTRGAAVDMQAVHHAVLRRACDYFTQNPCMIAPMSRDPSRKARIGTEKRQ